jgi:hypothetical protein
MAKNIKSSIVIMGMAILTGLMGWVARADVQLVAFKLSSGGSTNTPCSGAYTGYARMTNSAGSLWIRPPTNTTTGTFTDASGFGPPYWSVVTVLRQSDFASWCQTNSVTFPATNGTSYELTLWVKSTPPPPTNGQPLSLQIVWH